MTSESRRRLSFAIGLLFVFMASEAFADNSTAAQELYEKAKVLMSESRYAEACPKLEESQRLDPGGGTLLALAVCYEGLGRIASAWEIYKQALSAAQRDARPERAQYAEEHIQALEPKLSRLTVEVPSKARAQGLEVLIDETPIGKPAWGEALPVDPGEHVISARAPGHRRWFTKITIGPVADAQTVSIATLARIESLPEAPEPSAAEESDGTGVRVGGFVVLGLGAAGVVVGAIFGGLAVSNDAESDDRAALAGCTGEDLDSCPRGDDGTAAVEASEAARLDAKLANAFIIAGAAVAAAGVVMLILAPDHDEHVALLPWVGYGVGGAALRGSF